MPPIETDCRNDYLVLWTPAGHTRTGDAKFTGATQLSVRWEDRVFSDRPLKSNEEEYDAKIIVAQDIEVGTLFWKGKTTDLPSPLSDIDSLYEVTSFRKVPDLKGRHIRRICLVKKWSDTIPTIV